MAEESSSAGPQSSTQASKLATLVPTQSLTQALMAYVRNSSASTAQDDLSMNNNKEDTMKVGNKSSAR
jgi:hypothetical protein